MKAIVFLIYGVVSYLFFFAVFLYAIAFVGDLPVPRTIDAGGETGPLITSLIIDALLLGLFAAQHSVMARPAFKRWWTRFVAPPIERSTYVLVASAVLAVVCWFWRPLPAPIWTVNNHPAAMVLTALFWLGWLVVLGSTFLLSHFELFGLKQVWNRLSNKAADAPVFRTPLLYRTVRHPLYLGFVIAFWATPTMTLGHLVFALATTGYIVIAIQLEERDLTDLFGDRYRQYKRQAGMLWPKFGTGKG